MLEARLPQAALLKRILEAIRDIVVDVNFDCNDEGLALQAMDNSHVALVSLLLSAEGFDPYRCDRNLALGINLNSLTKVLKCAGNDDELTIKADDGADSLQLVFETPTTDRISEYELKLMDIDQEHLGIPDTQYDAVIRMPSSELQRIVRDMTNMGDSLSIQVTKEGIKFSANGDIGSGSVTLKQTASIDKEEEAITIELQSSVTLTFSLKYLGYIIKATPLSPQVELSMTPDIPLLIEYKMDAGFVKYYLAPKINESS